MNGSGLLVANSIVDMFESELHVNNITEIDYKGVYFEFSWYVDDCTLNYTENNKPKSEKLQAAVYESKMQDLLLIIYIDSSSTIRYVETRQKHKMFF